MSYLVLGMPRFNMAQPDEARPSIAKANEQGIVLLSTPRLTYEVNGKLWELGIRN